MSQKEWELIAQRGPYSGAFQRVLVPLQPRRAVDELHGLAFHKFRAAHKVMSRKITLLHLLSTHATAPAISKWIRATPSDTWVT